MRTALQRTWFGVAGGLIAGGVVGGTEALLVLTASATGEYWALSFGVVVYGLLGALLGLIPGALLALVGRGEDQAAAARAWAVAASLVGSGLTGWIGAHFVTVRLLRERPPSTEVLVAGGGALLAAVLATLWLAPIFLTRTPLRVLVRPKGALVFFGGLVGLSVLFSLAPGARVAREPLPARPVADAPGGAPDVLLIAVDGLRADALGPDTPALAGLAREGVLFEEAWAHATWSRGAVASLLLSSPPLVHGVMGPGDGIPGDRPGLPGALREAGYATAIITAGSELTRSWGGHHGFDWLEALRTPSPLDPPHSARHLLALSELRAWEQRRFRQPLAPPASAVLSSAVAVAQDNHAAGNRWFVFAHVRDPALALDGSASPADAPARYRAAIRAVDDAVAAALTTLAADAALDDTLVVVVGTCGAGLGEQGYLGSGGPLTDAALRVPILLRFPDRRLAGARAPWDVRVMDLAPTLAALAGAPVAPGWWGTDLLDPDVVDLLSGRVPPPPERDFAPVDDSAVVSPDTLGRPLLAAQDIGGHHRVALRSGGWKYARTVDPHGRAAEALYDLAADPREQRNLAGPAARRRAEMAHELDRLIGEIRGPSGDCDACRRRAATGVRVDCAEACEGREELE